MNGRSRQPPSCASSRSTGKRLKIAPTISGRHWSGLSRPRTTCPHRRFSSSIPRTGKSLHAVSGFGRNRRLSAICPATVRYLSSLMAAKLCRAQLARLAPRRTPQLASPAASHCPILSSQVQSLTQMPENLVFPLAPLDQEPPTKDFSGAVHR